LGDIKQSHIKGVHVMTCLVNGMEDKEQLISIQQTDL